MMIKFLDLQKINLVHQAEIEAKLLEVFRSGWYLLGNEVKTFENNLSHYIGAKQSIGVANALIGAGSVVTKDIPANTFWFGNPATQKGFISEDGELKYNN